MTHPRVGVGMLIFKDNKVLLGKRMGAHGENTWSPPGGHLEMYEEPIECAIREVKEETDLDVTSGEEIGHTNDIFKDEGKHYLTVFTKAVEFSGEPKVMEPNKCLEWKWFSWDELPEPLFLPLVNFIKKGYHPEKN